MRSLRLSPDAQRDIAEALRWTYEQFGENKYKQYQQLIREAVNQIAEDPIEHPARTRADLHPDARVYHIGKPGRRARHMFVYRVAAAGYKTGREARFDYLSLHVGDDMLDLQDDPAWSVETSDR